MAVGPTTSASTRAPARQHHSRWSGENAVANHQRVNVDQRAICGESGEQITTEIRVSAGDDEEPVGHERPQTLQTRQQGAAMPVDEHEYVARVTGECSWRDVTWPSSSTTGTDTGRALLLAACGKPDPIFFGCSVVDGFSTSPLKEPVMQERRDQGGDGDCDGGIKPGILADLGETVHEQGDTGLVGRHDDERRDRDEDNVPDDHVPADLRGVEPSKAVAGARTSSTDLGQPAQRTTGEAETKRPRPAREVAGKSNAPAMVNSNAASVLTAMGSNGRGLSSKVSINRSVLRAFRRFRSLPRRTRPPG